MRWRSGVVSQYVLAEEACGAASGIRLSSFQNFPNKESNGCHLSRDVEHVLQGTGTHPSGSACLGRCENSHGLTLCPPATLSSAWGWGGDQSAWGGHRLSLKGLLLRAPGRTELLGCASWRPQRHVAAKNHTCRSASYTGTSRSERKEEVTGSGLESRVFLPSELWGWGWG